MRPRKYATKGELEQHRLAKRLADMYEQKYGVMVSNFFNVINKIGSIDIDVIMMHTGIAGNCYMSTAEVAIYVGCTEKTVNQRILKNGMTQHKCYRHNSGKAAYKNGKRQALPPFLSVCLGISRDDVEKIKTDVLKSLSLPRVQKSNTTIRVKHANKKAIDSKPVVSESSWDGGAAFDWYEYLTKKGLKKPRGKKPEWKYGACLIGDVLNAQSKKEAMKIRAKYFSFHAIHV